MRLLILAIVLILGTTAPAALLDLPGALSPGPGVPDSSAGVPAPVGPALEGLPPLAPTEPLFAPPLPPDAAVAVVATAGGVAVVLAGFALYSRLSRAQVLDHDRRDKILTLLRAEPGLALTDVAKRMGLAWGVAVHHLDRLERAGYVTSEKHAGRRRYFPVGTTVRDDRAALGALHLTAMRDVAAYVASQPGATQTELAHALGLSPSAASKQVTKLETAGLVRRERADRNVRLHPEPMLGRLLA